jgi:CheY-like chemotaxis protein
MSAQILVVDDEEAVREALRRILEPEGYRVVEAAHGGIALELFRQHPIDLVIMDLLMPEQEGLETILTMRRLSPQIKIIAISGGGRYGMTYLLEVAAKFGADRIFAKPFDRQGLLAAIGELLAGRTP